MCDRPPTWLFFVVFHESEILLLSPLFFSLGCVFAFLRDILSDGLLFLFAVNLFFVFNCLISFAGPSLTLLCLVGFKIFIFFLFPPPLEKTCPRSFGSPHCLMYHDVSAPLTPAFKVIFLHVFCELFLVAFSELRPFFILSFSMYFSFVLLYFFFFLLS